MISLEKVHQEMNSAMLQNIADMAFEQWFSSKYEKNVDSLLSFVCRSFRRKGIWPDIYQKLAVETILVAKYDWFMKERKTLMQDEDTEQCSVCMRYYLQKALVYCDSCDSIICIECSTLDKDFDLTFCSGCYSLDSILGKNIA